MPLVPFPAVVHRSDELLPLARRLIDADGARFEADPDTAIACRPNCTVCCHQAVFVTPAELRAVHRAVDDLPEPLRSRIRQRITEHATRLRAEGVTDDSITGLDREAASRFCLDYFSLRVMCPLLEDGICSIREDRPLVCREYLVTSDPAECAKLDRQPAIVRIRARRDAIAGFRSASAAAGEPGGHLLALALDRPCPPEPEPTAMSGGALVKMLTGHYLPTAP